MDDLLTAMAGLPLQTGRDSRTLTETAQAEVAHQDAFLAAFSGGDAKTASAVAEGVPPDPLAWGALPPPGHKGQTVPMALAAEMLTRPSRGETVVSVAGQGAERSAVNTPPALPPVRDPTGAWLLDRGLPDPLPLPPAGVVFGSPNRGADAPLPDPAPQQAGRASLTPPAEVSLPIPDGQPSAPVTEAPKGLAAKGFGGAILAAPNPARPTIAVASVTSAPPQTGEPTPQAAAASAGDDPRPGTMPSHPMPVGREASFALAPGGNAQGPLPGIIEPTGPVPTDRIGEGRGLPTGATTDSDTPGQATPGQFAHAGSSKPTGMGPAPVPPARLAVASQVAAEPQPILALPEGLPPSVPSAAQGNVTAAMAGTKASPSQDLDWPKPWIGSRLSAAKTPGVIPVPSSIDGQGAGVPLENAVTTPRAEMALALPVSPVAGRALPLLPGAVVIVAAPGEAITPGAEPEPPVPIRALETAPKAASALHMATSQGVSVPSGLGAAALPDMPVAPASPTSPPSRVDATPSSAPVSGQTPIAAVLPMVVGTPAVAQPRPEIGMGGTRSLQAFALIAGPDSEPPFGMAAAAHQPMAAPGDRATRPDLPPQAARQIAVALAEVSRDPTGAVEVALDPPELGRVRLSLVEVNGAVTLSITAERPETADLMRRHLALLADEFARHGLDAPSVDISGGGQGGQGARDAHSREGHIDALADPAAPGRAAPPPPVRSQGGDGGLDLRL